VRTKIQNQSQKFEFAVSSLERNIEEQEAKTGYLAIRKMRPDKAECLWTVFVLLKIRHAPSYKQLEAKMMYVLV
jgi:hypothetical protein